MSSQFIDVFVEGRLARVSLNRPDSGNRVTTTMMRQLIEALERCRGDEIDIVLISGRGDDFCVGRDQAESLPEGMTRRQSLELIVAVNDLLATTEALIMVASHGRAVGFGCGLVAQADLSVVSDTSTFAFDEIKHGFVPAIVLTYLGDLIGWRRAFDLTTTGRAVSASEAERIGLVSRVVSSDLLDGVADAIAGALLGLDRSVLRESKGFLREIRRVPPAERPGWAVDWMVKPR